MVSENAINPAYCFPWAIEKNQRKERKEERHQSLTDTFPRENPFLTFRDLAKPAFIPTAMGIYLKG